ncbi:Multidrug resistance protein 1 [Fusarium oxysporum f. sp. albedinis]|nr:Multidrug resistance protein 1 [Fusarium oxysporum f. sp. albedinis]
MDRRVSSKAILAYLEVHYTMTYILVLIRDKPWTMCYTLLYSGEFKTSHRNLPNQGPKTCQLYQSIGELFQAQRTASTLNHHFYRIGRNNLMQQNWSRNALCESH